MSILLEAIKTIKASQLDKLRRNFHESEEVKTLRGAQVAVARYFDHPDTQKEILDLTSGNPSSFYLSESSGLQIERSPLTDDRSKVMIMYTPPVNSQIEAGYQQDRASTEFTLTYSVNNLGARLQTVSLKKRDEIDFTSNRSDDGNSWTLPESNLVSKETIKEARRQIKDVTAQLAFITGHLHEAVGPKNLIKPDTDPTEVLSLFDAWKKERIEEFYKRLGRSKPVSRRRFLEYTGIGAGAVALYLSQLACLLSGPQQPDRPTLNAGESTLTKQELRLLQEKGVFDLPVVDGVSQAEELGLGLQAKSILYSSLAAHYSGEALTSQWVKVTTPQFLKEAGLGAGADLAKAQTIFRWRGANGGCIFFDDASGMVIKVVPHTPQNTSNVRYLELSYQNTVRAWQTAGVPESVVKQIQLLDNYKFEGQPATILVTPNRGQNLVQYIEFLKQNRLDPNQVLRPLLTDYYSKVLYEMNMEGLIHADPNLKNMVVSFDAQGKPQIVPIDLAKRPRLTEKGLLPRWQYNELSKAASNVGVTMPTFDEYVAALPADSPLKQTMMNLEQYRSSVLADQQIMTLSLRAQGYNLKVVLPKGAMPEITSGEVASQYKALIEEALAKNPNLPQGGSINIKIPNQTGELMNVVLIKTNNVGEAVSFFNKSKVAEALRLAKNGAKLAFDVLFVWWIASELDGFINPGYNVSLQALQAFPDSMIQLQKGNAVAFLDAVYNQLIAEKEKLADETTRYPINPTPFNEEFFGITDAEIRNLIIMGVPQNEITEHLKEVARQAPLPPAPSELVFQSPFPILIDGAREPITAYFSAFESDDHDQNIIFWAQADTNSGKTTIPVTLLSKSQSDTSWKTTPLTDQPWSISFQIYDKTFTCGTWQSDGQRFEVACKPQP